MILMHVVIRYGGYMSVFTSICLFTANIIYACVRNPLELKVPFEDATLEFHWGWAFYLNLFNGQRMEISIGKFPNNEFLTSVVSSLQPS